MFNKKTLQKNISINDNRGFTLMETLVAIFILLISTTGPMVFSQNALRAAFQSRDQITAFYLAQDAIEFIKNRRDHNSLSGDDWLEGLDFCVKDEGINEGCTIDTTVDDGDIRICNPSSRPGCLGDTPEEDNPLVIDENGYLTNDQNDGESSLFSRIIYIDEVVDGVEAEVVVKVRWTTHSNIGVREITVAENIYNWLDVLGI
jgi:prepilin-type N-terminal cleavage/methylation domain-containing protein